MVCFLIPQVFYMCFERMKFFFVPANILWDHQVSLKSAFPVIQHTSCPASLRRPISSLISTNDDIWMSLWPWRCQKVMQEGLRPAWWVIALPWACRPPCLVGMVQAPHFLATMCYFWASGPYCYVCRSATSPPLPYSTLPTHPFLCPYWYFSPSPRPFSYLWGCLYMYILYMFYYTIPIHVLWPPKSPLFWQLPQLNCPLKLTAFLLF